MHDPPDLESAIERSLESRSARLDPSSGDLDDVFTRVERRRSRRRTGAVVGSVAAAGVGLLGIVAVADRRDATPASSTGSETGAAAVDETVSPQPAWRCHDQLAYWGESGEDVYFASCEQTTIDGNFGVIAPSPTTTTERIATTTILGPTGVIGAPPSVPQTTVPADDQRPGEQRYSVVAGDALIGIAEMFGVELDELVNYNEWPEGVNHPIFVGDEVRIPPGALVPDGLDDRDSTPTTSTTTTSTTVG